MTHKLTGREVYDALREQRQGDSGEYIAGFSTWVDGKFCFDALALRPNEIVVVLAVAYSTLVFFGGIARRPFRAKRGRRR